MKYVTLLFILLTFYISPLFAQNTYEDFERGLNLSETQKTKIEEIKKRYLDEWKAISRKTMTKKMELKGLYHNPDQNKERIERIHREIFELESAREDMFNRYRSELSRVLNDKQRERYNDFFYSEKRKGMHSIGIRRHGR